MEDFSSHLEAAKKSKLRHNPQFLNKGWFGNNNERTDGPLNGCHVSGTFSVPKVQGSFMVTSFGHGFFGAHTPHEGLVICFANISVMNFSHRIDELSFGLRYPGLVNPLDRTYIVAETSMYFYKTFIQIV